MVLPRVFFSLLLLVLMLPLGCAKVSRERTLPPSVRSVYVPIFVNRSAEPGLEERATVLTQEQFLADGRLNLAEKRPADAIILVTIKDYNEDAGSFASGDYPRRIRQTIKADVEVLKNKPGRAPYGPVREVIATNLYNSDKRTIGYIPEPEAKDVLLRNFAREVVQEVLTGRLD